MKADHLAAFEEIYSRYWKRLFIFSHNIIRDRSICENIVQDIFTSFYLNRKTSTIDNLNAYLYQATKFQVIKYLRKDQLNRDHVDRINSITFSNETEERLNLKELESSIKDAMDELPTRCREVFYLSRYEDLSHKQIANKMGISIQTVKNQITSALSHLRARLSNNSILMVILFNLL